MIARSASHRSCTRARWMPYHAAHAASVIEFPTTRQPDGDHAWDDSPVTTRELVRDFVAGALLIGGALIVTWMLLA